MSLVCLEGAKKRYLTYLQTVSQSDHLRIQDRFSELLGGKRDTKSVKSEKQDDSFYNDSKLKQQNIKSIFKDDDDDDEIPSEQTKKPVSIQQKKAVKNNLFGDSDSDDDKLTKSKNLNALYQKEKTTIEVCDQ